MKITNQLIERRETEAVELIALRAERDALLRHGFVPCDIPACNCGSWHPRFGYPERMREIADALADAGHELSNENGNKPLNALRQLVAERDALLEALRAIVKSLSEQDDEGLIEHAQQMVNARAAIAEATGEQA